ncbi:MAG: grpE [Hydrocarboniphaga sp.]|uniref:nucleotide exchange factor GrpE n=1 Tax=Hydrocarboniphaga sp. TaxID=2033016 RepID=UPI00261ABCA4|nr:nucleotide exchange factor GrpE [Hydrocarboniphaga sp.]MDB5970699.1 grpE [Hydrocarboniphaga sp.]
MTATPEPSIDETATAADAPPDLAALTAQIEDLRAQAQAAREAQLRALAELDNVRKRAEREIGAASKFGAEKLLGELLGISDSVDLGLQAASAPDVQVKTIVEGLELTRRQLVALLEKQGVTQVDPRGQPFNPDFHEAVSMVPSADVPPNHVLNVMQKGYKLHERLLRPAMVIVARAP